MEKISIWGVYPPPVGGVSIHIKREAETLHKRNELDKVFWFNCDRNLKELEKEDYVIPVKNTLRYPFLIYLYGFFLFIFKNKAKTIHFHNSLEGAWFVLIVSSLLKKKVVITIHDQMRLISNYNLNKLDFLFVNKLYVKKNIKWISVNTTIKEQLILKGVLANQISVIPAYLKNNEIEKLPIQLENFCNNRNPLLSIYGFSNNIHNSEDLYGIDMSIDLLSKLISKYKEIGLVICIPGNKNEKIMNSYYKSIHEKGLKNNIYIQTESLNNCNELWLKSDVFLRPTNTDGDALTVREALDMSCPVVASDCVKRPSGCVTFQNRNLDDFYSKVKDVLVNKQNYINRISNENDFFNELYLTLK